MPVTLSPARERQAREGAGGDVRRRAV